MDELLDYVSQIIYYVQNNGASLNRETQQMLANFLQEVTAFIQEEQEYESQQKSAVEKQIEPQTNLPSGAPSNDAQLLWILSGQQPQAFISYLRSFPTAETSQLVSNPHQLNATLEQLQRLMPQGEPPVIDGIQHADLNSSNVWGAAYDQRSGKMRVRFQGGSEYEYDGVPINIFNAFIHGNAEARTNGKNKYGRWWKNKLPSLGAAMNQYIKKGKYPYKRIR